MIVFLEKFSDPDVGILVDWPLGTYGLPKTKSGCPRGYFWNEGTRFHHTEGSNSWSNPYDLAGRVAGGGMEQKFCMKTIEKTSDYSLPWPKGQYCIFKKGDCPKGKCKEPNTGAIRRDHISLRTYFSQYSPLV